MGGSLSEAKGKGEMIPCPECGTMCNPIGGPSSHTIHCLNCGLTTAITVEPIKPEDTTPEILFKVDGMDEQKARIMIGEAIQPDNSLDGWGVTWHPRDTRVWVKGAGPIDIRTLEAIVWWVNNKQDW